MRRQAVVTGLQGIILISRTTTSAVFSTSTVGQLVPDPALRYRD
jgi:hypothetical protein